MTVIKNHAVHGEADREAARRYNQNLEQFVIAHNRAVNKSHDADPLSLEEERELRHTEAGGLSKSSNSPKSSDNRKD